MKTVRYLFLLAAFCTACIVPQTAKAHPHVFVDSSLKLNFTNNTLTSIDVVWTFDEMSSDMFLIDLDTNADGALTTAEWVKQRPDIEGYLGEQSFFVHVTCNGKRITLEKIKNFTATFSGGILKYAMTLPVNIAKKTDRQKVQIAIFDPSYYTDFYTALEAVSVSGKKNMPLSIDDAPELAFYQGQIIPTAVTFEF
ncbi:DUF1007 family protein [Halodesulfovibrio spirochaetisodalis]|uniref:ABC transporter substrate-binding protein n=1 Tax=Halodesulfovibrio spirochaetisodalis TaxID=1560234 RepID=A0A1B7XH30_9BACT|nr:DUF1007 family protein [Halodesulfovibrio spirochaetisodalis]OBQ54832.1 hypothetical protein SP90_04930 [Halodesulfovibrio spirochaetisodalis]